MDTVDKGQANASKQEIEAAIATIKNKMPQTYAAIHERAKKSGNQVFGWVRRGIGGEANCFWACENGHVVGTPFSAFISADVAQLIVQFLPRSLILLPVDAGAKTASPT